MATSGQILLVSFLEGKILIIYRTDNAIKNHFYSKLRKYIRKILKSLNKDNVLKSSGIDPTKFNSDKIYKIIKKYKIPYNTLTKESVLQIIINQDKNGKVGGKHGSHDTMLRSKLGRKRQQNKDKNLSMSSNTRRHKSQITTSDAFIDNLYSQPKEEMSRRRRAARRSNSIIYSENSRNQAITSEDYESERGHNDNMMNIIVDKRILSNDYSTIETEKKKLSSSQSTDRFTFATTSYRNPSKKPGN